MAKATERMRTITIVSFERYNPPNKAVNLEVRQGGPLKWVRWETRTHRDADILDLPPDERFVWQVLVELAGEQRADASGVRPIRMTTAQIAREADITLPKVEHAMDHLRRRGRIRYVASGRERSRTRALVGGDAVAAKVATDHQQGGHVPTDLRTHVPTDGRTDTRASARERTSSIEHDARYEGTRHVGGAARSFVEQARATIAARPPTEPT